jgi:hypothetical protein
MGGSHFVARRRADPELAERMLEQEEADEDAGRTRKPLGPSDAEHTREDELLTQIIDALSAISAMITSHPLPKGAKPKKPPPPRPRPIRGIDIARQKRRERYLEELDAEVEEAQARWQAEQDAAAKADLPD